MKIVPSGGSNWPTVGYAEPVGTAPPAAIPGPNKAIGIFETFSAVTWRWLAVLQDALRTHRRLSYVALFGGVLALALWSRYRYVVGEYTYTFGTGDAHLLLLKALFLREGILRPSAEMAPATAVFDQPPLIPLLFAGISRLTTVSLDIAPFIVVPLLTAVALLAFFGLVRRTFDLPTAVLSTGLLALLPRYSFDSTEPEKAPFVVSFAVVALWLLVKSEERRALLPLAGLFLGLAVFAHITGYFFLLVFVLSYFGLRGLSRRTLFDRRFLASLAIPAFFIACYFVLSNVWARPPTDGAVEADPTASGVLPGFLQLYVDTLTDLARSGFTHSAWNIYFEGIRRQVTTPIYVMAIGGLVIALAGLIRTRRPTMLPVLLWMTVVTLCFAVQYPASSHGSRYPSYVTPAFLVLASFFVVSAARLVMAYLQPRPLAVSMAIALAIAAIGLPTFTYATAPNPGLRDLYGGNRDLASFVAAQGLLDDGSHILYLGWPSVTLNLLEHDIDYRNQLHSFGFGLRDLDEFTPEFITANEIRYYADNHAANDGFGSSNVVMANLLDHFRMNQIGRFERSPGNYVTLYEIADMAPEYQGLLRLYLAEYESAADAMSLTVNPSLRWESGRFLPGWSPNGDVQLEQLDQSAASGVLVRNRAPWGGIRQLIDVGTLQGRTVTAIATVRGAGSHPAHSAVLSLAREGAPPFSQIFVPLEPGENLLTLETELPHDIDILRITVATGKDDDGDLAIQQVHLIPEPLARIVDAFPDRAGVSESSAY